MVDTEKYAGNQTKINRGEYDKVFWKAPLGTTNFLFLA